MISNPVLLWPLILSACAAGIDLRRREIPDTIPVLLIVTGIGSALMGSTTAPSWWECLAAMFLTMAVSVPGFARGALGGGDVKLLIGLACWFGLSGTVGLLFWTAIGGAVFAFLAAIRGQKDLAFAPAIALASVVQAIEPSAFSDLICALQRYQ